MNSSYVAVPAEKAYRMALDLLERIIAARGNALNNYVESRVRKLNSAWYRKFFRMAPVTKQQVLDKKRDFDEFHWIETRYWYDERLAKMVLAAAKVGEPLYLSLEDVERLT
jgi:hypothetical protein